MPNYLNYETTTRTNTYDYGIITAIYGDNTVDVNIGGGTDFYGNPLSLSRVRINGNYVPKVNDYILVTWENGTPVVYGNTITGTNNINNNVIIVTPTDVAPNTITGEHIQTNTITAEHITTSSITANHISANSVRSQHISGNSIYGYHILGEQISGNHISTNAINALHISASSVQSQHISGNSIYGYHIEANQISGNHISADAITALQISANSIRAHHISANSLYGYHIAGEQISGNHIVSRTITADRIAAGTLSANSGVFATGCIIDAYIASLSAEKIVAGDIQTDRMKTNVIEAINLSTSNAVIDNAKIGDIVADKITSGILDTSKVRISTSSSGTGARFEFLEDGYYLFDESGNVMSRMTVNQGFVVHIPAGIKLDNSGSIRVGPTEDVVIAGTGIKAKANTEDYTNFFDGMGIRTVDPTDSNRQVRLRGGAIELTKDNWTSISTAITADGIYGSILTDNSLPASKFDTTPPAIPTWRDEGITSVLEQTAETNIVSIIVKWNEVSDADLKGYKIYLDENNTGTFYPVANIGKTNEYKIRGVKPNTVYSVKISSYDVQGNECSLALPPGQSYTTYPKTITTVKDTVAPAQPSGGIVYNGFKLFCVTWDQVTKNSNGTDCYDLNYYKVKRASSEDNFATWTTIAQVKGTSVTDESVEYEYEYKYKIIAVDTSGNESLESAIIYAGYPSKIGSGDIVAHSITTKHIATQGLSADVIKTGKLSADLIDAGTITADKFENTLYGDITQALRYVQGQLDQLYYSWSGNSETWNTGTFINTYSYDDVLMLDTVHHWNEVISSGIFTRNSVAYKSDGTQVEANVPRFEKGRFSNAVMVEDGTVNILNLEVQNLPSWGDRYGLYNETQNINETRTINETLQIDENTQFIGKVLLNDLLGAIHLI